MSPQSRAFLARSVPRSDVGANNQSSADPNHTPRNTAWARESEERVALWGRLVDTEKLDYSIFEAVARVQDLVNRIEAAGPKSHSS